MELKKTYDEIRKEYLSEYDKALSLNQVDSEIIDYLNIINQVYEVTTLFSCGGHAKKRIVHTTAIDREGKVHPVKLTIPYTEGYLYLTYKRTYAKVIKDIIKRVEPICNTIERGKNTLFLNDGTTTKRSTVTFRFKPEDRQRFFSTFIITLHQGFYVVQPANRSGRMYQLDFWKRMIKEYKPRKRRRTNNG